MVRTQISLTREQYEGLQRLAKARETAMAAVLRDLVDELLEREESASRRQRADRLVGAFSSGDGDVSEAHDQYLDEVFDS